MGCGMKKWTETPDETGWYLIPEIDYEDGLMVYLDCSETPKRVVMMCPDLYILDLIKIPPSVWVEGDYGAHRWKDGMGTWSGPKWWYGPIRIPKDSNDQ